MKTHFVRWNRILLLLALLATLLPAPAIARPARDEGTPPAGTCEDKTCKLSAEPTFDAVQPDLDGRENLLRMRTGVFDPDRGDSQINPSRRNDLDDEETGLRLIQFTGPILDEWYAALEASGLEVVTYIPDNAYLVWGDGVAVTALKKSVTLNWAGAYHPFYALHPALAQASELPERVKVTVQVYAHEEANAVIETILKRAAVIQDPHPSLVYQNMTIEIAASDLDWLSALPGVVNVEPAPEYQKHDEIQGQIMAGNLEAQGTQPSGVGYLAWLDSLGFSTTPADYPIVDVTDDGIDNGSATPTHADFYEFGSTSNPDRLVYNYNGTSDTTADGGGGHGNLNAAVVAGYNTLTGYPYEDANGYNYGLGINPYGRVAGSKIFRNAGTWDYGGTNADLIGNSYTLGARISSNSWGDTSLPGNYTTDSQEYDALVRDALSGTGGNQGMIIIFSAGNSGSGSNTIGSPGTGKNVITVGASENYRPLDVDGCETFPDGADSAQDIADFSSRGPTDDGRVKPDLVAPGTHVAAAASQSSNFNGNGVCGAETNDFTGSPADAYYPTSPAQTRYTWSSGTSHSAPAVAGAASLIYRYYQTNFGGAAPSPAMTKAYLVNATSYMTGVDGNGNLPTHQQGYGLVDLSRAFDYNGVLVQDQTQVFGATGATYSIGGVVADTGKPLRVVLAWTDAPGATTGNAYVNNLDLEVQIGGKTYLGNVFSGETSVTGGTADVRNNVESVFLSAGTTGAFTVTVRAANIAGDGVPGNGDSTDQDFALVIYNTTNSSNPIGYLVGQVTDSNTGAPLPDARVFTNPDAVQAITDANGEYRIVAAPGTYTVTAQLYDYQSASVPNVVIAQNATSTQNFAMTFASTYLLTGTVTDASTGWPIYASIHIEPDGSYPENTVWSNPWTGVYSATLMGNHAHTLDVAPWSAIPGYEGQNRTVNLNADRTDENFALSSSTATCNGPGYQYNMGTVIFSESFNTFSSLPNGGWAQLDVKSTTGNWSIPTSGTYPSTTPHSGSRMASFNSYTASYGHWTRLYRTLGLDLSAYSGARLTFWMYNYSSIYSSSDRIQVQVSTNGGTVWENVGDYIFLDDNSTGHWVQHTVALEDYTGAGMTDVRVALLGKSGYGYNIHIDDLEIRARTCAIPTGGLVAGSVAHAGNDAPLTGALVRNQDGYAQTTLTTPDDDAIGESFYVLYSPAGSKTFTATLSGYTPVVANNVAVVGGETIRKDFLMGGAYVSQQTGNWSGSAWASGIPGASDWVTISTGHVVTVDAPGATCFGLTIMPGATLVIPSGNPLTVGNEVRNRGTLRQTKAIAGTGDVDFHLRDGGGDVIYYGLLLKATGFNLGTTQVDINGAVISGGGTLNQTLGRWFDIAPQNALANVPATFYYRDAELNGNAAATLNVYHYSGSGAWELRSATARGGSGDARWIETTIGPAYSPFVLKSPAAPTAVEVATANARSGLLAGLLALIVVGMVAASRRKQ
ncbi:MAG: S8 family serine peptidase [Anaerolineae bacterium]|nr:S8 family serine peptidase [Anaerolineae bacterium]